MRLRIQHRTTYTYSDQVFLEPHHLYFSPMPRPYFQVETFDFKLDPRPNGLSGRTDAEGNQYQQCWFSKKLDTFDMSYEMIVQTNIFNPFDFFVESRKSKGLNMLVLSIFL